MIRIICCLVLCLFLGSKIHAVSSSLPVLGFRENVGQVVDQYGNARADLDFQFGGNQTALFIGNGKMLYQWNRLKSTNRKAADVLTENQNVSRPPAEEYEVYRMEVELQGAHKQAQILKELPLEQYDNFYGSDGKVKTARYFQKIVYKNIYANIDWVLYVSGGELKYDFVVHPGGNATDIKLKYLGAESLAVQGDGSLLAKTPFGVINEQKPYSYILERKEEVGSAYTVDNDVLSFSLPASDGTLVIDPIINVEWSTYYGGIGAELSIFQFSQFSHASFFSATIATDPDGNVVLYGSTSSRENIATTGSFLNTVVTRSSAFIVKLNKNGKRLWSTYYGDAELSDTYCGSGHGVACDNEGNIFITGTTNSKSGIATPGSFQDKPGGWDDLFLAKFDKNGLRLWGTYYGAGRKEFHGSVAVSPDGNKVYLAGCMDVSTDVNSLISPGAFFPVTGLGNPSPVGILVSFDGSGNRNWATFIQPVDRGYTVLTDMTLDPSGNIFLCGTSFADIGAFFAGDESIATFGSFQSVNNTSTIFGRDGFLQKWDPSGKRLWGTFYGGESARDFANGIACDAKGNVYLTGATFSENGFSHGDTCIATKGSYQEKLLGGGPNGYLAKFDGDGKRAWATYLGNEGSYGIGLSCADDYVFATGVTLGKDWASHCAYQNENNGAGDAYLGMFDAQGVVKEVTFYGGEGGDGGYALAATKERNSWVIYMVGGTSSHNQIAFAERYPMHQEHTIGSSGDYFLAKFIVQSTSQEIVSCFAADSILLRPRYSGKAPYSWSDGSVTDSFWVKTSGSYIASYDFRPGCPMKDTFLVHIYPLPGLTHTDSACLIGTGRPADAEAVVATTNKNLYQFSWYKNGTELIANRERVGGDRLDSLGPGSYTLVIHTPFCDTILPFVIQQSPSAVLTVSNDTMITAGKQVHLWAEGESVSSYTWYPSRWLNDPNIADPIATPQESITYYVVGVNDWGCTDSAKVHIDVNDELMIPNAFSPNGDGINDVFKVNNGGYRTLLDFSIFNRWGERLYAARGAVDQGWDGTYNNGKHADAGVYYYVVKSEHNGKVEIFKGDFTLIR